MVRLAHPFAIPDVEPFPVLVPVLWAADSSGRATVRDALTRRVVRPPAVGVMTIGGRLHVPGTAIDREGPFYLVEFAGGSRCWVWAAEAKLPTAGASSMFRRE